MKLRYEIVDNDRPTWRGQRFTSLDRAMREIAQAVGRPGRWSLRDRQTGDILTTH